MVLTVNLCFKVSDLLRKLFPFSCKLKEIMPLGTTKLSKSSKLRTQRIINIQRKDRGMSEWRHNLRIFGRTRFFISLRGNFSTQLLKHLSCKKLPIGLNVSSVSTKLKTELSSDETELRFELNHLWPISQLIEWIKSSCHHLKKLFS